MERTIQKWEFERIVSVMIKYGQSEGFIDDLNGRLEFFMGDPCFGGVHAMQMTLEDVREIIADWQD